MDQPQVQLGPRAEPAHERNQVNDSTQNETEDETKDETKVLSMRLLKPGSAEALSRTLSTSEVKTNHIHEKSYAELRPHTYKSRSSTKESTEIMPAIGISAIPSSTLLNKISSGAHSSIPEGREKGSNGSTRAPLQQESNSKDLETTLASKDGDSRSEIQSIMDQFDHSGSVFDDNATSSRLEFPSSLLRESLQHPPRKSSLEPIQSTYPQSLNVHWESIDVASPKSPHTDDLSRLQGDTNTEAAPHLSSIQELVTPKSVISPSTNSDISSSPPPSFSLGKPLPPEPDPEPDLPFDFHRFLEQLRHRTADPVAKFLRSFLVEFSKKQWMAHEQVKIISDFLTFISSKMAQCEVWREVSEAEFDNAKEGMEKLVMNRLYSKTFSPSIPAPVPLPENKGKYKNAEKGFGSGRRGQHQEDIERDDILGQKVRIYGWIEEEHLDVPPVGEHGRRFLALAQQGLRIYNASRP